MVIAGILIIIAGATHGNGWLVAAGIFVIFEV